MGLSWRSILLPAKCIFIEKTLLIYDILLFFHLHLCRLSFLCRFTSLHLSLILDSPWGTKDDRAPASLHLSLFLAFRRASLDFQPVHSVMLCCHCLLCLPWLLRPGTVPTRIIFGGSDLLRYIEYKPMDIHLGSSLCT